MTSKIAISELERMRSAGLTPSFQDVIRLNALGLKLEAAKSKSIDSTFALPRIAQVSENLAFRQPTVGHEIWFDKITRLVKRGDFETVLAIKAFGLSRPASSLPDPDDPKSVALAIDTFCRECCDLCRDHIYAALCYVIFGADPSEGETPPKRDRVPDGSERHDWEECVALGVLNEGRVALWGISAADMREMTPRQLRDVIRRAYSFHNLIINGEADQLEGEFYATVDEIEKRLTNG